MLGEGCRPPAGKAAEQLLQKTVTPTGLGTHGETEKGQRGTSGLLLVTEDAEEMCTARDLGTSTSATGEHQTREVGRELGWRQRRSCAPARSMGNGGDLQARR